MNAMLPYSQITKSNLRRLGQQLWQLTMAVALSVSLSLSSYAQSFSLVPLGPVVIEEQGFESFALGVNNPVPMVSGGVRTVVGFARATIGEQEILPICWTVDNTGEPGFDLFLLKFPGFSEAQAADVNNMNEIVGFGKPIESSGVGLYWASQLDDPVPLPGLSGELDSRALRINDDGVIVGVSWDSYNPEIRNALAWRIKNDGTIAGPLVLPTRARGARNNVARGVGPTLSSGITEIVGSSDEAPVLWRVRTGVDENLELVGSIEVLDKSVEATGITSTGAVCGRDSRNNPVIWEPLVGKKRSKTTLKNDGSFSGSPGAPLAMNDAGMVVGHAGGTWPPLAVVWASRTSPVQTLQSLITGELTPFVYLDSAYAVNDVNDIVGYGWMGRDIGQQAFIALPVALPVE